MSEFFIRRPIVAIVISIVIVLVGVATLLKLPIEQYPDLSPPTIRVETTYPGASAAIVETQVTKVLEDTLSGIEPLPRFPSIVRDLSIVVSERLPAADLRGTIRSSASTSLVSIEEFDRYQGKGVPDGMISLSIRLTFRDRERTLTDAEVQRAVDAIVSALASRHGASLRT